MDDQERDQATDAGATLDEDEAADRGGTGSFHVTEGLDREYESMGTGEAGAGVGGGGASSSDVEWDAGAGGSDEEPEEELTSGGAMTNEQEFTDR